VAEQLSTIEQIRPQPGTYQDTNDTLRQDDLTDRLNRPFISPYQTYRLDPTTSEVVGAWWNQETILGDVKSFLSERRDYRGETPDPDFNPYSYYRENKNQYTDITSFLDGGHFDHVQGPIQFDAVASSVRTEMQNRELMERGDGWQSVLGMGASILDPSTLIPIFGWGMKANMVRKAIVMGASTGGVVAGEEIIHHQRQRMRTLHESMMGIGIATGIGAGFGIAGAMFSRSGKLLDPQNPHNPLAEKNLTSDDAGSEWNIDDGLSVSESMAENGTGRMSYNADTGVVLDEYSWDAWKHMYPDQGSDFVPKFQGDTFTPVTTRLDRGIDWTQNKIGFLRTPVTVALKTASPKVRALLNSMAELGVHSSELAQGATRKISAEMHKNLTVYGPQKAAEDSMVNAWYGVMKNLGVRSEVVAKTYSDFTEVGDFVRGNKRIGASTLDPDNLKGIPLPEFQYYVWRRLNGDKTSHPNAFVERGIVDAAKGYRSFTQSMLQRAIRTGLLSDKQEIANYFPQIWNADAIIQHGTAAKEAFKAKFRGRYKTEKELDDFVDELVEKLGNRDDFDITDGLHKGSAFNLKKSGRVESRELFLKIDPETGVDELSLFEDFLHKDVSRVMKQYADDMGGRIVLTEYFGRIDPKKADAAAKAGKEAKPMDALSDQWKEIQEEFKQLRKAARDAGESVEKLNRDENLAAEAIINVRDRLLNTDRRPSSEGWGSGALYAGRMARRGNFLRYMGSVMLASLTDIATISLSHGAGKHLAEMGRNIGRISAEAKSMNNRELAFFLYGAEGSISQSRTAKLMGIDDAIYRLGYGTGRTKKVSGGIEAGANWLSGKMNVLNLMQYWNSRHKFITGHVILGNLLDDAANLAGGSASKYKWRELGLSDDMMLRIDGLMKKHGYDLQREKTTFRWPDTEKWQSEVGGREAVEAIHAALIRSTERAVITPSIADLPMFHSKELGQILLQFNSFGFAAVNKFVRNLSHAAVNERQLDALVSTTWALGAGTAAFAVREGVIKGRFKEDAERPMPPLSEWGTWTYEAIDRSGLMMWMMPYMNAGMKLAARPMKEHLGIPIETPSRMGAQDWWQQLLGPTFGGLVGDMGGMTADLAEGDLDKFATKGKRLLPYRNVFHLQLLHRLAWGEED